MDELLNEAESALSDLADVAEVLRGDTWGDEGDRAQKISTARWVLGKIQAYKDAQNG